MVKQILTIILALLALGAYASHSSAQTSTFTDNFTHNPPRNADGTYAKHKPTPFTQINQDKWDIAVHARDDRNPPQSPVDAHHGADCEAPITNTTLPVSPGSNPLITHPTNGSAEQHVFLCRDHLMTSSDGGGYSAIYLTPNHMVDFSQGTATIKWTMSTYRSSERDWVDIWISPFEDNLQLPLNPGFPDLQGPPKRAIQILMHGPTGSLCPNFWLNGSRLSGGDGCPDVAGSDDIDLQPGFPDYSPARRDPFEIQISRTHLKVGMPTYNIWFYDGPIPSSLMNWDKGIVQFAQHAYTPEKGTYRCPSGGCGHNTWHWDDFSISPTIPFTIIKADKRWVSGFGDGSDGTISTEQATVTFSRPAPANSFLRFSGWSGNPGDRAIEFSTNVDPTWRLAQVPFQDNASAPHPTNFWTSIPAGTTRVQFRHPQLGWYHGGLKDFAIWSQTGGGTSTTPIPTTPPANTPVPTIAPTVAPGSSVIFGNQAIGASSDSSNSNTINGSVFTSGATGGTLTSSSVHVRTVDASTSNRSFEIGIYSDNNGRPGALLAKSDMASLTANTWNTANFSGINRITISPNTKYWLMYNTNGLTPGVNNLSVGTGSVNQSAWETPITFGSPWPNPFPTPTLESVVFSIYATYTAAGSQAKPGDVDSDGLVGIFDYNEIVKVFGATGTGLAADLIRDGVINSLDLNEVVINFNR